MNFKTYLDILKSEGLEESPLADGVLIRAMEAQERIKRFSAYKEVDTVKAEIKKLEERKIRYIWEAIDLARMYPPDSDTHKIALRAFRKRNKREYKGFLNEYQILKVKKQHAKRADIPHPSTLTGVEKRVNDRWEQAMKKMKGR